MSEHNDRYGWRHRHLRARVKREVEAGVVFCSRCGLLIRPGQVWDLDHSDGGGPRDYRGASHARCNRQTSTHRVERERATPEPLRWSRCWLPGTPYARCHECRAAGVWLCENAEAA